MSTSTVPTPSTSSFAPSRGAKAPTLSKWTMPVRPSPTRTCAVTSPHGHWMRTVVRGSRRATTPRSTAHLAIAMVAWPHIVEYPSLWQKSTARSARGWSGSTGMTPYMSAWPRGSCIRKRRRWSRCSRA